MINKSVLQNFKVIYSVCFQTSGLAGSIVGSEPQKRVLSLKSLAKNVSSTSGSLRKMIGLSVNFKIHFEKNIFLNLPEKYLRKCVCL